MITTTKLDPIETASRDELQALQTQRLKWTLKHAYEMCRCIAANSTPPACTLTTFGN